MKMILLIDLDDTLLGNDMGVFVPAYLQKLGSHLAKINDPKKLIEQLLVATQSMMINNDPALTLKEKFDMDFYPVLGLDYQEAALYIEDFYLNKFPEIQSVTQVYPDAIKFIKEAIEKKHRIVIATNPLFPRTAIIQRLEWAGLAEFIEDFEIITSYEKFHFAKPNPAYYAEILAQLGWPEEPVLMIGNDKELDIEAASKLGIATYWINPKSVINKSNILDGQPVSGEGDISNLFEFIEKSPDEFFKSQFKSSDSIQAILRSTPAAIKSLFIHNINPEDDSGDNSDWGICEILCHLRDVDIEINIPRIKMILEQENQFIPAIDADTWAIDREYSKQDQHIVLQEFISARLKMLKLISGFTEESWLKKARHSILGPTNMKELLQITARHDRLHVQQFYNQLLNK